jgi:glycosyltransferase involved in cell wall biosynthesis
MRLQFKRHLNRPRSSDLRITFLGVLSPKKRPDIAIRATGWLIAAGYPASLMIAGDGPQRGKLEELSGKLGVGNDVEFLGYVGDPFDLLVQTDVVLMCCEQEAMGRVTAEAMSAGCVVVGRRSGGTVELIENRKTGFLYEDEEELHSILVQLAEDPEMVGRVGHAAHLESLERFCLEKYADAVVRVWECAKG